MVSAVRGHNKQKMDEAALAEAEARATEDPTAVYDDVRIEDMEFVEKDDAYYYPCPCGDRFLITVDELFDGEEIAHCPSCSLRIKVLYDPDDFVDEDDAEDEGEEVDSGDRGEEANGGAGDERPGAEGSVGVDAGTKARKPPMPPVDDR